MRRDERKKKGWHVMVHGEEVQRYLEIEPLIVGLIADSSSRKEVHVTEKELGGCQRDKI